VSKAAEPRAPRRYHSPRRADAAAATRRAILAAARDLFVSKGYRVATVADIARRAEVAVDTVYATVGRKPALLRAVLEGAISGADHAVAPEDREYVRNVRAETSAQGKIAAYVAGLVDVQLRLAPIYLALRDSASTDPESTALWREISERRARNMRDFAAELRATGQLRPELSDEQVADIVWSMNGAEYWTLLVVERGWRPEDFAGFLVDAWTRTLVAEPTSTVGGPAAPEG
jgi:AcrR family transcriptional regulator